MENILEAGQLGITADVRIIALASIELFKKRIPSVTTWDHKLTSLVQ